MGPGFFWFGFFIRVRLCHDIQNSPLTKKGGCRCKAKSAQSPRVWGQKRQRALSPPLSLAKYSHTVSYSSKCRPCFQRDAVPLASEKFGETSEHSFSSDPSRPSRLTAVCGKRFQAACHALWSAPDLKRKTANASAAWFAYEGLSAERKSRNL